MKIILKKRWQCFLQDLVLVFKISQKVTFHLAWQNAVSMATGDKQQKTILVYDDSGLYDKELINMKTKHFLHRK